jgi:hypothetical protein
MSTIGVVAVTWAGVLGVLVLVLVMAGRRRRGSDATRAHARELRQSRTERRDGPRDRRQGLPDLRADPVERRSGAPDRRLGLPDRRTAAF